MISTRSKQMVATMRINSLDKILQLIPSLNYPDTKRLNNSVKEKLDGDTVGKVIAEREQSALSLQGLQENLLLFDRYASV